MIGGTLDIYHCDIYGFPYSIWASMPAILSSCVRPSKAKRRIKLAYTTFARSKFSHYTFLTF